jgi:hypothetical protein
MTDIPGTMSAWLKKTYIDEDGCEGWEQELDEERFCEMCPDLSDMLKQWEKDYPLDKSATDYLDQCADTIEERGKLRDSEEGERSMGKTVAAFNTLFGKDLTETQGWQFMQLLKMARMSAGVYHEDDYVDNISYGALAAETAFKEFIHEISNTKEN